MFELITNITIILEGAIQIEPFHRTVVAVKRIYNTLLHAHYSGLETLLGIVVG